MAFSKLTPHRNGADPKAVSSNNGQTDMSETWELLRAVRDVRTVFGLRPSHIQTLQAMFSVLKPGHGQTVFASNAELCRRAGGIDERTLRRHIARLEAVGFVERQDSPNRKRYRVSSPNGATLSFGLCLAPLFARMAELLDLAETFERERRETRFIRKAILVRLAQLEARMPDDCDSVRKSLRRKLSLEDHQRILAELETLCAELSVKCVVSKTPAIMDKTSDLSANDGQIVRHYQKSEKILQDSIEAPALQEPDIDPKVLIDACQEAKTFAHFPLESWQSLLRLGHELAPMMGIDEHLYRKAAEEHGPKTVTAILFLVLQMQRKIRNLPAYFQSVTLGRQKGQFNIQRLLRKYSADTLIPA